MKRLAIALTIVVAGCKTTSSEPGIEVRVVEKVVEVQKPCPGERPKRPTPLALPLPDNAIALAAVLGAKLAEYAAPGKYADKADALISRCLEP